MNNTPNDKNLNPETITAQQIPSNSPTEPNGFDRWVAWIEKAFSKDQRHLLPLRFLRLCQVASLFSLITIGNLIFTDYSSISISSILGFSFLYVLFLEATIRLLKQKKNLGIGFYFTILFFTLLSMNTLIYFIFFALGLYSILNPESQNTYMKSTPEGVRKILSNLGINYIQ
jgi:hypothetical protein